MSDPAADRACLPADSSSLDRIFLLTVVPQVICSCTIAGVSAHRLVPIYAAHGVPLPPLTTIVGHVVSPLSVAAIAAASLLGGVAVASRRRDGPAWATTIGSLGLTCVLLLAIWQFVAGLPMQFGIRGMNGADSWEHFRAWICVIPFALTGFARLPARRSSCAVRVPWIELAHLVLCVGTAALWLPHDRVHRHAVAAHWGPLAWDLSLLELPESGFVLSLVGNVILTALCLGRPTAQSRWGPYFILAVSTGTILLASRRLAYWVQAIH